MIVMDINLPNQSELFLDFINSTVNITSIELPVAHDCTLFSFVFFTLLLGTSNILGILGNIISVAVLQRDSNNKVAVFLLQALAVVDSFVLLISLLALSIIYALLPFIGQEELMIRLVPYVVKYFHPVGYMAQCGTIWITVLLAINRYIAIVKPFHAAAWCTLRKARLQVAVVLCAAIVLNFPRFFQYQIVTKEVSEHEHVVTVIETSIGEHSLFGVIYTNFIYTVLVLFMPLAILTVLNMLIVKEIKNPKNRRTPMNPIRCCFTHKTQTKQSNKVRRNYSMSKPRLPEEDNITFIMVIIIVVLIVCHTPDRIFFIYRYFFTSPHDQPLLCGQTLYYVYNICNLLIVVNSSCNFVIYFLLRRRFRQTLKNKICAWTKFKKYREPPSFLEAQSPVALLERQSDFGITYKTPAERDQGFSNFSFKSTRLKSPSVPCL